MHFAQLYTPGIAQCSYVIGSGDRCVVVDPLRDIEPYLEKAAEFKMDIVAVLETHLHADFVSGHMELKAKTGAEIYAPAVAGCAFLHHALADEEEFTIGSLRFKLLETPGHTPDSSVYIVTDLDRGDLPILAFTGDTLMVGDVGRPDLFPSREEELAERLFHSLERLKKLPDHIEIYPAHGMGSLCGRALSAKLWSTIGTERLYNYALQHDVIGSFKQDLLTDMPPAPDHFARCSEINRRGPAPIKSLVQARPLGPTELADQQESGASVVDVRPYHSFAAAHVPGSYSISRYGNLATFAGWVIPPEEKIALVLENEGDLPLIRRTLLNVGLDNIIGYLQGSIEGWVNNGLPVNSIETMSVQDLRAWIDKEPPLVLDNRAKSEWKKGHIAGSISAPAPDTRHLFGEWDREKPAVVLCNTSNRSMTAGSILKQNGFRKVINILGGTTAWSAAGYPLQVDGEKA